jgi:circadian clock protein KaiC
MGNVGSADASSITRLRTGISGFDEMIGGGIPEGNQVLLIGNAGSGKSLFAFEMLYRSAKAGIPCADISIDQTKRDLLKNVSSTFPGFSGVQDLIGRKKLTIVEREMDTAFKTDENMTLFISEIIKTVTATGSKLIVIDSLSLLRSLLENDRIFTRSVNFMVENLHRLGVTTIVTIEVPSASSVRIPGLLEDSMFDGVIKLASYGYGEELMHRISVLKMRYTKYKSLQPQFDVTEEGIVISKKKEIFA